MFLYTHSNHTLKEGYNEGNNEEILDFRTFNPKYSLKKHLIEINNVLPCISFPKVIKAHFYPQ